MANKRYTARHWAAGMYEVYDNKECTPSMNLYSRNVAEALAEELNGDEQALQNAQPRPTDTYYDDVDTWSVENRYDISKMNKLLRNQPTTVGVFKDEDVAWLKEMHIVL